MKCPKCGSLTLHVERRPNGDTICPECDYTAPTSSAEWEQPSKFAPPPNPVPYQVGWMCPKCGGVNAPFVARCPQCGPPLKFEVTC